MPIQQNEPLELRPADALQPAVPVSVDAGWSKAGIITTLLQSVVAIGAIITFLGLGDQLWIVRAQRFLASEQGLPVIAFIATLVSLGVGLYRTRGRQLKMSFLASLLPNEVAQVKGDLHAEVQAKVDQATVAGLVQPVDPAGLTAGQS